MRYECDIIHLQRNKQQEVNKMSDERRKAFKDMVERFKNLPEKKQDQMLWYGKAILDIEESESAKKEVTTVSSD